MKWTTHSDRFRTSKISTIQTVLKNRSISDLFFLISKANARYLDRLIVLDSFSQASILRTLPQFGWLTDSVEAYFSRNCK